MGCAQKTRELEVSESWPYCPMGDSHPSVL